MSRARHTARFGMPCPADELFPLFSPEGEKRWVPGWDYVNVMGGTEIHEGYVFQTRDHDHAAGDAIWIVSRHDDEQRYIQLYKVEPGHKVGIVEVRCTQLHSTRTAVEVTYEYIGLSAQGDRFIEAFTADDFGKFIARWKALLMAYMAQGHPPCPAPNTGGAKES